MITPINFQNTHKTFNNRTQNCVNTSISQSRLAFGNKLTDDNNSYRTYTAIRAGRYDDAAKILSNSSFDFNPNWTSMDSGLPLLAAIYFPESNDAKKNAKSQKNFIPEIISRILLHPQFEPNRTFLPRNSSLNSRRMSYHELALKNNDMYLLQMLGAYGATLDDFTDAEMSRLDSYVKTDGYPRFLLYAAFADQPSFIAQNRELQRKVKGLEKTAKQAREVIDRISKQLDESDKTGKPLEMTPAAAQLVRSMRTTTTTKSPQKSVIKGLAEYSVDLSGNIPESLDQLGGMVEAKKAINNFIIRPWNPQTRALLKENNVELPNGFMMYGPPGCGKTYIAKVIAKQLGFPMYEIELGSIGNSYAYTTNNRLRKIFTELEKHYKETGTPSILFLDEIDSVAASRKLSRSDWKRDEINTLISLLNNSAEKGIIVIGATNLIENVDDAVLRVGRFDKKIEIQLPDKDERKEILEKIIAKKPIIKALASFVDELADLTDGKSCSDISASLNVCARNAVYDNKTEVSKEDFINAMQEIEYEENKTRRPIGFYSK